MNKIITALLVGLAAVSSAALAQQYPSRPVTVVVPNPPGGLTDVVARLAAEAYREANDGKPFLVENRPGASSVIGYEYVAKSPADGYMILLNTDTQAYMPAFANNLTFDPVNDFDPITMVLDIPVMIVGAKKIEAKNLAELVKYIKSSGGKVNYASGGTGTINHVAGVLFEKLSGTHMTHIPYQGGGPAIRDILAGQVELFFPTPSVVLPFQGKDQIRIWAVASDKRWKDLPDVPTAAEAGLPGFAIATYAALSVAKGTPTAIVNKLNRDFLSQLAKPAWREKFDKLGNVIGSSPEDARKRIIEEARVKTPLVREAGIKLQ